MSETAIDVIELQGSSDLNWQKAFPVLLQLREGLTWPRLTEVLNASFAQRPQFIAMVDADECVAVAAFRLMANTHIGLVLYVDDLVVDERWRSLGFGRKMMDEIKRRAKMLGAKAVDLDSGVQRNSAHRFYFENGFHISSHHFRYEAEAL